MDVRPGEGRLLLESAATLFGLVAAHTLLETARDALFLGRSPPSRLTFVYGLLALLAAFVGRMNTRFVRNFGRRNALIFTLFAAAYGTILLYLAPPSDVVYFVLYVWSGLLGSVLVVQFWMFVARRFTVAQGKRLFGPLAAGGVLGAVAGAGLAVPLLELIPVAALLPCAAGVYLATAIGVTTVPVDRAGVPVGGSTAQPFRSGLALFRDNPYLVRLALLVAVSTAAVLCADYLFKSVAAERVAAEDLGDFFAKYYAALNVVALGVQLLLAQAIVRRTGVVIAFLVLPALLVLGAAGTILTGGALLAVLATKGADGSLRHSLHRIVSELLWMPVPEAVRVKSKVLIDTVIVRGTQGLTAAVLLGMSTLGLGDASHLAILTGSLALAWILGGLTLRRAYLELFRTALQRHTPRDAQELRLDLDNVEVVVEALSSRDTDRATAAIQLLASSGRARLIPALILYHEAAEVLLAALEVIATDDRDDWMPLAVRLLEHEEERVRFAALRALARAGDRDAVEARLLDISPAVRAHAAYWLAEASSEPPETQEPVRAILDVEGEAGCEARVGLLEAIAAEGQRRWADVVLEAMQSDDPRVAAAATRAMARVEDPRFIPMLIERLRYREGRAAVREAIVQLGEPALEALERALRDPDTDRRVRRHVPRTISRFGTQRAADILCEQLAFETHGRVRYKILRGLGRMVTEHAVRLDRGPLELQAKLNLVEHLRLAALWHPLADRVPAQLRPRRAHDLLIGLLEDKMKQALERASRLLQLVHAGEDLRTTFRAAESPDRDARAQALEFLDALTLDAEVAEIRELLRVALDDLPWSERLTRAAPYIGPTPSTTEQALARLRDDSDVAVRGIAELYARSLEAPDRSVEVEPEAYERAPEGAHVGGS